MSINVWLSSSFILGVVKKGSSYEFLKSIMSWGTIIPGNFFLKKVKLYTNSSHTEIHCHTSRFINRSLWFMENTLSVNISLWTFNLDTDCGVCNIMGCQWGYNHVFLSHIPQVFVSEASRLLTDNGIALHLLCVWSRGDNGRRWLWNLCCQLLG